MKNKTLIIGGNGFIGKNIANYFNDLGDEIAIYDLSGSNKYKSYVGNILTDDHLNEIISNYQTVIYLVTSVSPKKSMDFPDESYIQDIPMLLRVLDCCRQNNVKRVIFSSSGGTVYGEGIGKELKEDTIVEKPINHYGVCKVACEKILQLYNKLYDMENIILRISNPYGKGQNPASGVGVITTFAQMILDYKPITLYGDGSNKRDFINIDYVAEAFYKAAYWNFDKNVVPVFNVGSGVGLSLNDIIEIISNTLGEKPIINYLPSRDFDVKENVLNMEKSKKYLKLKDNENEIQKIKEYVLNLRENHNKETMGKYGKN
jgi:UDP-glucose 4-epimerase